MQVAMWLVLPGGLALATGREDGHVQEDVLAVASLTPMDASGTSPVFSIVKR
jgi:hypothetical protein